MKKKDSEKQPGHRFCLGLFLSKNISSFIIFEQLEWYNALVRKQKAGRFFKKEVCCMGGLFGLILLCVLVGGGIKLGTDIILNLFLK